MADVHSLSMLASRFVPPSSRFPQGVGTMDPFTGCFRNSSLVIVR